MRSVLRAALRSVDLARPLQVTWSDGSSDVFGSSDGTEAVPHVRFLSPQAERSLALDPDLRLGELFMNGEIVVETGTIFDILMAARSAGRPLRPLPAARLLAVLRQWTRRLQQHNRRESSRCNVEHHYDLDSGLYEMFLDRDRQYSCAYFESPDMSLDDAQLAKKRHVAAKLQLAPGQRILDIGSGWGGMGLYLAQAADADVTGITLSKHQHRVSSRRAETAGLADRVRFLLQDYRDVEGRFDRIISVGMFEHVGVGFYRDFFGKCRDLLASDGVMLLHTIGRLEPPGSTNRWIQKYIFPGGYIPALSEVTAAVEREGLMITDVEVLRHHYGRTLRHWRERFMANRQRAADMFGERFCRMWEFYLAASESSFYLGRFCIFQIQIARKIDSLPTTRDYMPEREAHLKAQDRAFIQ